MVITDSGLVDSARKWDLNYLIENMGDSNCAVMYSKNHKFKFFDDAKVTAGSKITPPNRKVNMKMTEFVRRLEDWQKGNER